MLNVLPMLPMLLVSASLADAVSPVPTVSLLKDLPAPLLPEIAVESLVHLSPVVTLLAKTTDAPLNATLILGSKCTATPTKLSANAPTPATIPTTVVLPETFALQVTTVSVVSTARLVNAVFLAAVV